MDHRFWNRTVFNLRTEFVAVWCHLPIPANKVQTYFVAIYISSYVTVCFAAVNREIGATNGHYVACWKSTGRNTDVVVSSNSVKSHRKFSDVHKLCIGSQFPQSATPLLISMNITRESIIFQLFCSCLVHILCWCCFCTGMVVNCQSSILAFDAWPHFLKNAWDRGGVKCWR